MSFGDNKLSKRRNLIGTSLLAVVVSAAGVGCSDTPISVPDGGGTTDSGGGTGDGGGGTPDAKCAAATPTFSVPGGSYSAAQTVSIATTSSGATIYYTIDGNTPTAGSSKYSTPISVSDTTKPTKVSAYAVMEGCTDSAVNAATYTITADIKRAATPTITPASGSYTESKQVTIATTEKDGTIIFTTNNTQPSKTNGTVYTTPFTVVDGVTTVIAITTANNVPDSLNATATYTVTTAEGNAAAPSFSPVAGEYTTAQSIVMTTTTTDATICYTVDGNTPACDNTKPIDQMCTGTSARYVTTSPPSVDGNKTVKALACKAKSKTSTITSADYTFRASLPTVTASGTINFDTTVFANVTTPNAVLLYTLKTDGTTPADPDVAVAGTCTPASGTTAVAAGSFPWNIAKAIDATITTSGIRRNAKYKFRTCRTTYNMSAVLSADYNAKLAAKLGAVTTTNPPFGTVNTAVTPVFDGTESAMVTLGADATLGILCFTNDGITAPSCNTAKTACGVGSTLATYGAGPPAIHTGLAITDNSGLRNIRAISCKPNATDSDVLTGTYTYQLRAGADPATASGSVQNLGTPVNIKLATLQTAPGAAVATGIGGNVYYTTNGTSPVVPATCGAAATAPTVLASITAGLSPNIDLGTITPIHASPAGSTFKLVTCATNYNNSAEVTVTYSAPGQLTAPTISPASGTYNTAFDTNRTPDTPGGTAPTAPKAAKVYFSRADLANTFVCWTDNGSDPECANAANTCTTGTSLNATVETGVAESSNFGGNPRVVKARTCRAGFPQSPISTATYTFKVLTPVLPAAPTLPFGNGFQGNISGNNPGVLGTNAIQVNGTPTYATYALTDGAVSATDPICGTSPTTLNITSVPRVVKVRACSSGFSDSDIATATYTTASVAQPTFVLSQRATYTAPNKDAAGKYHDYFDVTVASSTTETGAATAGVGICYTTDGTAPACGSFSGASLSCLNGSVIDAGGGASPTSLLNTLTPTTGTLTLRAVACSSGLNTNVSTEKSATYAFTVTPINTTAGGGNLFDTDGTTARAIAADAVVGGNKVKFVAFDNDVAGAAVQTPTTYRTLAVGMKVCFSQVAMPTAACTAPIAGSTYACFDTRSSAGSNVANVPEFRVYATKDGTVYVRACKAGLDDATTTYNATGVGTYSRAVTSVAALGGAGQFVAAENEFVAAAATAGDGVKGYISFDSANLYLGSFSAAGMFNHAAAFQYFYMSGAAPVAVAGPAAGINGNTGTLTPNLSGQTLTTAQTHGFGTVKYLAWYNATASSQGLVQWNGTAWTVLTGAVYAANPSDMGLVTIPRNSVGSPTVLTIMGGNQGDPTLTDALYTVPGSANNTMDRRLVLDLAAGTRPTWAGHICTNAPAAGTGQDFGALNGQFAYCP